MGVNGGVGAPTQNQQASLLQDTMMHLNVNSQGWENEHWPFGGGVLDLRVELWGIPPHETLVIELTLSFRNRIKSAIY